MVKNTIGGSKTKGMARKNLASKSNNKLRFSQDVLELYAVATKANGNGMFEVLCSDKKKRLLHIRGKFRGKGKRDNFITTGTYLLIGLREWEDQGGDGIAIKTKLPNCDLLTVYSAQEKDQLISSVTNIDWSLFKIEEDLRSNNKEDIQIEFSNNVELPTEIQDVQKTSYIIGEEEVNIDDI